MEAPSVVVALQPRLITGDSNMTIGRHVTRYMRGNWSCYLVPSTATQVQIFLLPSRHPRCRRHTVVVTPSPPHHCRHTIAATSSPPRLCCYVFAATSSPPRLRRHTVVATLSSPHHHCHVVITTPSPPVVITASSPHRRHHLVPESHSYCVPAPSTRSSCQRRSLHSILTSFCFVNLLCPCSFITSHPAALPSFPVASQRSSVSSCTSPSLSLFF